MRGWDSVARRGSCRQLTARERWRRARFVGGGKGRKGNADKGTREKRVGTERLHAGRGGWLAGLGSWCGVRGQVGAGCGRSVCSAPSACRFAAGRLLGFFGWEGARNGEVY